ncbi:MAG: oligosaccharide flippase family protein [Rhodothermales bacterium]
MQIQARSGFAGEFLARIRSKGLVAQLVRGSSGGFVARIASAGVAFLSTGVLTNHLGPAYGDYSYALAWLTVLATVGRLGFNKSAIRYLAAYRGQEDWARIRGFMVFCRRTTYLISCGATLLGASILWLFWDPISAYYGGDTFLKTMMLALLSLPLLSYLQVSEGVLDGFKRVAQSQVPLRIARPGLIALFTLAVYSWTTMGRIDSGAGSEYISAEFSMVINLAATLLALILAGLMVRRTLPAETRTATPVYDNKNWYTTSRDMMWTSGFNLVIFEADLILLGLISGTDDVGIFNVASKVAQLLIIALTATNAILYPITADLFSRSKLSDLQKIVTIGANAVFAVAIMGAVVLYFGSAYMEAIFGEGFGAAAPLLKVLILGQIVNAFTGPALLLLNMTGHQRDSAKIMGFTAIINVTLNVGLITAYGAIGAAYATALSIILWNTIAAFVVWYRLKIVSVALYRPKKGPSAS